LGPWVTVEGYLKTIDLYQEWAKKHARYLKIGSIWFNRTIGNIKMATKIRHPPNELHLELQAVRETSADFLFFLSEKTPEYILEVSALWRRIG